MCVPYYPTHIQIILQYYVRKHNVSMQVRVPPQNAQHNKKLPSLLENDGLNSYVVLGEAQLK